MMQFRYVELHVALDEYFHRKFGTAEAILLLAEGKFRDPLCVICHEYITVCDNRTTDRAGLRIFRKYPEKWSSQLTDISGAF